ncbi:MAG: hypothetical protein Q9204_008000 [Flavoplaca sp. TL-2023a]
MYTQSGRGKMILEPFEPLMDSAKRAVYDAALKAKRERAADEKEEKLWGEAEDVEAEEDVKGEGKAVNREGEDVNANEKD